jgi:hypothetical protein
MFRLSAVTRERCKRRGRRVVVGEANALIDVV